jgi:hypothetical protein
MHQMTVDDNPIAIDDPIGPRRARRHPPETLWRITPPTSTSPSAQCGAVQGQQAATS